MLLLLLLLALLGKISLFEGFRGGSRRLSRLQTRFTIEATAVIHLGGGDGAVGVGDVAERGGAGGHPWAAGAALATAGHQYHGTGHRCCTPVAGGITQPTDATRGAVTIVRR